MAADRMPDKKQLQPTRLSKKVLEFFRTYNPTEEKNTILVAVSGGPDSVCLFHLLYQLRDRLKIMMHVVHLDHQLRGKESGADAEFVRQLALRFEIPATIGTRDVQQYREAKRLSLEEAAREVRYEFFVETAQKLNAGAVVLGHTRDDNVETILMHLIRGTGTRGLRGLMPVTEWHTKTSRLKLLRPLLNISRRETQEYCRENHFDTRTDSSNLSPSFFRNRVRLELLPLMQSYNPRFDDALLRTASTANDEFTFLDEIAKLLWNDVARQVDNTIILHRANLLAEAPAIRRQLLRIALEKLFGSLKDIEIRHIEAIMGILPKPAGRKVHLPDGMVFSSEYDRYIIGADPKILCPLPELTGQAEINVPGVTRFSDWEITTEIFSSEEYLARPQPEISADEHEKNYDSFSEAFDYDQVDRPLIVRSVRTGERFQPLGMGEQKKIARFMIDARIPSDWRERVPIMASTGQVAWVVGWRIDDRVKVTNKTKKVLTIKFEQC
jgi:tRNA(Ile)-lysidine synthase